jgi:uncharacterized protein YprB with RNaseH-like and TPR domain
METAELKSSQIQEPLLNNDEKSLLIKNESQLDPNQGDQTLKKIFRLVEKMADQFKPVKLPLQLQPSLLVMTADNNLLFYDTETNTLGLWSMES